MNKSRLNSPNRGVVTFCKLMTKEMRVCALVVLASAVSAFGVGCSTAPSLKDDPQAWQAKTLQRANERWALIAAKEFDKAFAMYTEASRKDFTPAMLRAQIARIRALSGSVEQVECNAEYCEATVNVVINLRIPRVGNKQQTAPFKERWVVESGELRLLRPE
jgi:hypothetical protein